MKRYIPDAGDIVWLHFNPQAGHEQAGHRPAVVLSPATYNRRAGLMLCCPMTTQIKGYPCGAAVPASGSVCALVSALAAVRPQGESG